jgi:hypothetical protein
MKCSKGFKDSTVQLILNEKESVVKVADTMKVSLVNDALTMAINHRNPQK